MARRRVLLPRRRVHVGPRRVRRECLSPRGHQGARLVGLARLRGHHRLLSDGRASPPCGGHGHRSPRLASGDRGRRRAAGVWRGSDGVCRRPLAALCCVCLHGARLRDDVGDRPQRDGRAVVREVPGPGDCDGAHRRERWRDGRGAPCRAVDRSSRFLRDGHGCRRRRHHHARAARPRGAPLPRPRRARPRTRRGRVARGGNRRRGRGAGVDSRTGASVARPLERGRRLRARADRPGRLLHPPGQACRASAGRDRGRLAGGRDRPGRAPGPPCSWSGSPTGSSCGATLRPSSPPRRWPSW